MKKLVFFFLFMTNIYAEPIEISDAVVRLIPPVSKTTAMFFKLKNNFKTELTLIKVESDISDNIEIHHMKMENGKMEMRSLPNFTFKPNEESLFKSGGNHIMIFNLKRALIKNEKIKFKFSFDNKTDVMVDAIIKDQ